VPRSCFAAFLSDRPRLPPLARTRTDRLGVNPFRLIGAGCTVRLLSVTRQGLGGPLGWLSLTGGGATLRLTPFLTERGCETARGGSGTGLPTPLRASCAPVVPLSHDPRRPETTVKPHCYARLRFLKPWGRDGENLQPEVVLT
jgi:hypothetical protein